MDVKIRHYVMFLVCVCLFLIFNDIPDTSWNFGCRPGNSPALNGIKSLDLDPNNALNDETLETNLVLATHGRNAEAQQTIFKSRSERVKRACENLTQDEIRTYSERSPTIYAMIVNDDRKLMYCRLAKAGSTSAVTYFSNLNRKFNAGGLRRYSAASLPQERAGREFYYISEMTVPEALIRYSNYTKLLFVRHPLQRLVSSFYYSCVTRSRPFGKGVTTMEEFVDKLFLQKEPLANIHWRSYQHSCQPCLFHYDYIVKTESSDVDIERMNLALGLATANLSVPHKFGNPLAPGQGEACGKYDAVLKKLAASYPRLMEALLEEVKVDMAMFGYTWQGDSSHCET